ncbi:hypothetical protein GCM10025868_01750 [Angustibacter aerolatus]|uniref:Band 7 domain-containing protein n=1 Tax=Angustibacter aerolatus TaxID=1162965 RepID=A0ABQ6JDL4_9ACTN|nr:SPFH domain-containing protein [Angustibacter aerolatus]GMA84925.1 hypothetical protein GCM10025868_01750 [Angustibacter aerolatus]
MTGGGTALLVVLVLLVLFAIVVIIRTIRIVPQATAVIIERLGRYSRTLDAGLHILIPFIDKPRAVVDLREQVVSFPPQPVITSDNLVVSIDTVIYFQPTDPKSAVYEIANYIQGIEQPRSPRCATSSARSTSSRPSPAATRSTARRGACSTRRPASGASGSTASSLKAIDPPHSVQDSMEKQMRAERDRRATILTAEGVKQSQILTAEGEKQSNILRAEGTAQARILNAQGEARAIQQVFDAIHRGNPDQKPARLPVPAGAAADRPRRLQQAWIVPSEPGRRAEGHRRDARQPAAAAGRRRRVRAGPRWWRRVRARPGRRRAGRRPRQPDAPGPGGGAGAGTARGGWGERRGRGRLHRRHRPRRDARPRSRRPVAARPRPRLAVRRRGGAGRAGGGAAGRAAPAQPDQQPPYPPEPPRGA